MQSPIADRANCSHSAQQPWMPTAALELKALKHLPRLTTSGSPNVQHWGGRSVNTSLAPSLAGQPRAQPSRTCRAPGLVLLVPTSAAAGTEQPGHERGTEHPQSSYQLPTALKCLQCSPYQDVQVDVGLCICHASPTATQRPRRGMTARAPAAAARSGTCFYSPSREADFGGFLLLMQLHSHPM